MRHLWRFALVAVLAAGGLPLVTQPDEAAAAPAAPTYVCGPTVTVQQCAVFTGLEGVLITMGMSPTTIEMAIGLAMTHATEGGWPEAGDAFECAADPACTPWHEPIIKQRIKETAKRAYQMSVDALELAQLCEDGLAWSWVCPDPEDLPPDEWYTDGGVLGPPTTYPADLETELWQTGHTLVVATIDPLDIPLDGAEHYSVVYSWNGGSSSSNRFMGVRLKRSAGTISFVLRSVQGTSGQEGAPQTIPWDPGDGVIALAVRTSSSVNGGVAWLSNGTETVASTTNNFSVSNFPTMAIRSHPANAPVTEVTAAIWRTATQISGTSVQTYVEQLDPLSVPTPTEVTQPPRPGTEVITEPEPAALPSTTTVPAPPVELEPAPNPPDTDTHEQRQTGLLENLVSGVASGFNWLGNMVGGLLRSVVDMLRWLGDIFGYWIQWLWERLGQLLRSIRDAINALGDLLEGLLQQLINGVGYLLGALWDILTAIWSLPAMIGNAILSGLEALFVPSGLPEMPACADTFPCNYVAEASGAIGELKLGIDGVGGCVAPEIGWTDFTASFPPPPGCTGGNDGAAGVNDDTAGDLFGWRSTIRTVFALALWVGFFAKVLQMAPWSKPGDMPLSEGQVTV